jgi:hypothetical protein
MLLNIPLIEVELVHAIDGIIVKTLLVVLEVEEQSIINLMVLVNLVVMDDVNLGMTCLVLVLLVDGFVIDIHITVLVELRVVAVKHLVHGVHGVVIVKPYVMKMITQAVDQEFNINKRRRNSSFFVNYNV